MHMQIRAKTKMMLHVAAAAAAAVQVRGMRVSLYGDALDCKAGTLGVL